MEAKQKPKKKHNPSKNFRMLPVDIVLEQLPYGCQRHQPRDLFVAKRGCHHFDKRLGKGRSSNYRDDYDWYTD